jgi:dCTP deaminase
MILNDRDIRKLCLAPLFTHDRPMIEPFSEAVSGDGVISYGLSHAGYDLRLGPDILLFDNQYGGVVNPKQFNNPEYHRQVFREYKGLTLGHKFHIPPHGYILGHSLEYLRIPDHLKGRCVGKSTLARSGILINTTPLEPGWEGHLTIEIGNQTPCPAVVFIGEGIAQLEFETLSDLPEKTYAGKKYQGQTGVTPAKVL